MLRAARQMAYRQVPVLGVNLGRLGFLADVAPQDFSQALRQVLAGDYRVTSHLMFECELQGQNPATHLGLNEVVLHAMPPFHMLELEIEVQGVPISRFGGDGLIVSTPIGSTAHNLSAGGPILAQELSAFAITPLCAHTLTFRPIVESAEKNITIRLGSGTKDALAVIDGQVSMPLSPAERLSIRKAPVVFQMVKVPGRSFYQTLRDKLRWGTPPSYTNRSHDPHGETASSSG